MKAIRRLARSVLDRLEQARILSRIHYCQGVLPAAAPRDLGVVVLVRDGEEYVDEFMAHYRSLGLRRFCFIDNQSADGTVAKIRRHKDASLWTTDLAFADFESLIRSCFLLHHFRGRWVFCVDIDEHFVYPGSDKIGVTELVRYLEAKRFNAVTACMLDMLPETDRRSGAGGSFRETYPMFDLRNIEKAPYPDGWLTRDNVVPEGIPEFHGGVRSRMSTSGHRFVLLKHPLMKIADGLIPYTHPHYCARARIADVNAALLHYKFIGSFLDRARALAKDPRTSPYWARENRIYVDFFNRPGGLDSLPLARYAGCDALVDAGLLRTSDAYRAFCAGEREPARPDGVRTR
jgi:hypothetical protein